MRPEPPSPAEIKESENKFIANKAWIIFIAAIEGGQPITIAESFDVAKEFIEYAKAQNL